MYCLAVQFDTMMNHLVILKLLADKDRRKC
jgi:hypothetical protein